MSILMAEAFSTFAPTGVATALANLPGADTAYRVVPDPVVPTRFGISMGQRNGFSDWSLSWQFGAIFTGSAYGNGVAVAVGRSGLIAYSTDFLNWSKSALSGVVVDFCDVQYLNNQFVALTKTGAVYTSTDGINWTLKANQNLTAAAIGSIDFGNGLYLMFAGSVNTAYYTSPDLVTWTQRAFPSANYGTCRFGNGAFAASGNGTTAFRSTDGITWTSQTAPNGSTNGSTTGLMLFGAMNGVPGPAHIRVAGANTSSYSTDGGLTWTAMASNAPTTSLTGAALVNGRLIFGLIGQAFYYQANATVAPVAVSIATGRLDGGNGVTGLYAAGVYVLMGIGVSQTLDFTRYDSIIASAGYPTDIAYGNGVYVASYGTSAPLYGVYYSPDGVTWKLAKVPTSASSLTMGKIAFGNGLFVVGDSGGNLYSSTDGANWQMVSTGVLPVGQVSCIAYGNGVWIAAVQTNSSTISAYSTDGINWVAKTITSIASARLSIKFGAGLFIAVYNNTGSVYTSPDALTWTARLLPNSLVSVDHDYDPTYGWFLTTNTANNACKSVDGITWTVLATPTLPSGGANQGLITHCNGITYVSLPNAIYASPSSDQVNWTLLNYPANVTFGRGVSAGGKLLITSTAGHIWNSVGPVSLSRTMADTTNRAMYTGFSLYVPPGFTPAASDHSIRLLGATFMGMGTFELRNDLSVAKDLVMSAQSSTRLTVGAVNYIEMGADPVANWFRIWVNDLLCYDGPCLSTAALTPLLINAGVLYGTDSFVLGNWYILDTRGTFCNTRLGSATRIITRPPTRDVSTQLYQPSPTGKPNSQVVGAALGNPVPPLVVGDTVGNTDYYAADDNNVSGFAQVYAVVVRTVGQNLGTAPHALSALVKSNGVESVVDGPSLAIPNQYGLADSVFYTDPNTAAAWTPAAVKAAQFGVRIKS